MTGTNGGQQGQRTPRAKQHKHNRSQAGPVSDSDGINGQPASNNKKNSRRNQQARNGPQQVSAPAPAWQQSVPTQMQGSFDAQGNFISPFQMQQAQVPGMFYVNQQPQPNGATPPTGNQHKKKGRQTKNGQQVNRTPPHAASDNEHIRPQSMIQQMTPAKAAAYAGPTFHASPAASNLPIPKFFSKSAPNDAPPEVSLQARLEQEPEKSDGSEKADSPPTTGAIPVAPVPVPDRQDEPSPLDFLFKAQKEQKAKRLSGGANNTPPPKAPSAYSSEPPRANNWQSIYGNNGYRNHQRQPSTGSGKEMFMMELDGKETSPAARKYTSPPPLPRIPNRSVSEQSTVPQLHNGAPPLPPQGDMYNHQAFGASAPVLPPYGSEPRPMMDNSFSPFNRGPVYPARSAESTPTPQRNGGNVQQNNLHYGNRNLSPLFKAAKQDPNRPPSSLRQEVHPTAFQNGAVELPDNTPSRPGYPQRVPSDADKRALAYLQSQVPSASGMPQIPLPRAQGPLELEARPTPPPTGVTPPGYKAMNPRSIEEDLKRMLKLTGSGGLNN